MVAKSKPVLKLVFHCDLRPVADVWTEGLRQYKNVWLSPTNHSSEQCSTFTFSSSVIIDLSNKALIFLLMSVRELLKHWQFQKKMKGCLQRHVWPYIVWESSSTSLIISVITVNRLNSAYRTTVITLTQLATQRNYVHKYFSPPLLLAHIYLNSLTSTFKKERWMSSLFF